MKENAYLWHLVKDRICSEIENELEKRKNMFDFGRGQLRVENC